MFVEINKVLRLVMAALAEGTVQGRQVLVGLPVALKFVVTGEKCTTCDLPVRNKETN